MDVWSLVVFINCIITITAYMDRCFKDDDLSVLWTKHIGSSQFIASPVVSDLTVDDVGLEIIVQTQTGDLSVVQGHTGETVTESQWPVKLNVGTLHSSPLLYDVNGDGSKDIIVISTEGDILVYSVTGQHYSTYSHKLKPVYIKNHNMTLPVQTVTDHSTMNGLLTMDKHHDGSQLNGHVFSTGVIEDVNSDNVIEELVLPVTYMNDDYVASSVVVFNLTAFQVIGTYFTELDVKRSAWTPYAFTSPLVISYRDDRPPHILLATSGVKITHLDVTGRQVHAPFNMSGVSDQLIGEDVYYSGSQVELIYSEIGHRVVCLDSGGIPLWITDVNSHVTGIRLFERKTVDGSLVKIIVVGTSNGQVWLLNG